MPTQSINYYLKKIYAYLALILKNVLPFNALNNFTRVFVFVYLYTQAIVFRVLIFYFSVM